VLFILSIYYIFKLRLVNYPSTNYLGATKNYSGHLVILEVYYKISRINTITDYS
jgi:hypothetical protein